MTTAALVAVAVVGLVVFSLILKRAARAATFAALALLVTLIAYYVWPTPYRFYSSTGRVAGVVGFRENRFTGSVDALLSRRGWIRISEDGRPTPAATLATPAAKAQTSNGDFVDEFRRARDSGKGNKNP